MTVSAVGDDETSRDPSYREWRGLIVGDYDRAVLRVAITTRDEHRQLLFGWVELLPPEVPSPPQGFAKEHFKNIQFSTCRVVVPLDEGIDWYEAAWAGSVLLPKSTITVDTGDLVAEPPTKRFALPATPPFSPTWHMTPRLHRLVPVQDLTGEVAMVAAKMTEVAAYKRARVWLEGQLHFDALAHDDWLGSIALVAPNPLLRDVQIRIASRDAANEIVEVGGELRAGKRAESLKAVFQERRDEAFGVYSIKSLDARARVREPFAGAVADLGLSLSCDVRGILHESAPSWFMRGFETRVEAPGKTKAITVPARKAAGTPSVVNANVKPPESPRLSRPVTGLSRIAELEIRHRRRFGNMRPITIGPEQRDTLIFKSDRAYAVEQIRRLIGRARERVVFVDFYFRAPDLLEFATAVAQQGVSITVLVGRDTEILADSPLGAPPGLTSADWLEQEAAALAADDFLKAAALEVKVPAGGQGFHDRFLIVDQEAWHCGHSFNKVGDGDYSAMTRIARPDELIDLVLREVARAEPFSRWKLNP